MSETLPESTTSEPSTVTETLSAARSRPATFEAFKAKPRRVDTVRIPSADEEGNAIVLTVKLRALGGTEYDRLVAKHEPTPKQKERGESYNPDTFAPALIAECSAEPKLTEEQMVELYADPRWSGGELGSLFLAALRLNNAGLDVPFTVGG